MAGSPFTASNLGAPYTNAGATFTIAAGETVRFDYVGGTCTDPPNLTEKLYGADGGAAQDLSPGGAIWGLGAEGFLYVSTNGYGTFISNGIVLASGGSVTYTPTTARATCAELAAYQAAH